MYELKCLAQNYDWGNKGSSSLVAKIITSAGNESLNENKNYAEYWMGSHVNGPSTIKLKNNEEISLSTFLSTLGIESGLPFLFKVLSIKDPLSIQVHPDKEFAEILNKVDNAHYKDDNHKPELAVAISENFELFYGIVPYEEAVEMSKLIFKDTSVFDNLNQLNNIEAYPNFIKLIVSLSQEEVEEIISKSITKINNESTGISENDNSSNYKFILMKKLFEKFGYDRGVIFSLFMNYYKLQKGDAIFINPNIPHAYIKGDCMECMANSDNVIRLGLTPKFVDKENFIKILENQFDKMVQNNLTKIGDKIPDGFNGMIESYLYRNINFKEFYVLRIEFNTNSTEYYYQADNFSILFLIQGSVDIVYENYEEVGTNLSQGDIDNSPQNLSLNQYATYFIDKITKLRIKSKDQKSELYIASY